MSFLTKGKEVERLFSKSLNNHKESTKHQDISQHWDLSTEVKFDVKGLRTINRGDEPNENIQWIEIKNVHGDKGWLYGEADYFVFEMINYWIIVEKKTLQDYISKNTIKQYAKEFNKLYQRKGRKDILTLVKTIDLIYLSIGFIKK